MVWRRRRLTCASRHGTQEARTCIRAGVRTLSGCSIATIVIMATAAATAIHARRSSTGSKVDVRTGARWRKGYRLQVLDRVRPMQHLEGFWQSIRNTGVRGAVCTQKRHGLSAARIFLLLDFWQSIRCSTSLQPRQASTCPVKSPIIS